MITAVDSNVLLDVFGGDARFGDASREALRKAAATGQLVACDVVWAETLASFTSAAVGWEAMDTLRVAFSMIDRAAVEAAAEAWRIYRGRGGKKDRVIADFLIGGHAIHQADRILTRDRGFYRGYFERLVVIHPSLSE